MATIAPEMRQWCVFPDIANPLGDQIAQSQIVQITPTNVGVYTLTKVVCHCSHLRSAYTHCNLYS